MKVSDLFDISYGQSLSLNALNQVEAGEGIALVTRTAKNNGVSAWVEPVPGVDPLPAGLLTVCLRSRNHALSTFVQPRAFYCGYHVYVLTPRKAMTLKEKLWWAQCIQENRYRYNFGRQANRSLASLELPSEVPDWVQDVAAPQITGKSGRSAVTTFDTATWTEVSLSDLFDLRSGRNILKRDMKPGSTAYIGASASNNGVTAWIEAEPDYLGGQITVSSDGSIGEAFYQPKPFVASGPVTVLVPKTPLDVASALFLCTVIRAEKFRWNYGRKWVTSRMKESKIRIPTNAEKQPDWEEMRRIVKSLPVYSLLDESVPSLETAPERPQQESASLHDSSDSAEQVVA